MDNQGTKWEEMGKKKQQVGLVLRRTSGTSLGTYDMRKWQANLQTQYPDSDQQPPVAADKLSKSTDSRLEDSPGCVMDTWAMDPESEYGA